jgi:branched-chain amino acid transport system substrate-binding protein
MESIYQGVELAVAQLNAQRGDRPPLTLRRTPTEMTSAVQVAALLRDDPAVVGVVGHPESGTTQEALPIYEDANGAGRRAVAVVTPTATSPALSGRSRWLFRICPTDASASEAVARFVVDSLHARRAAIVYRNDSYGRDWTRSFAAAYRAAGGTVVQRDPYVSGGTEWAAYAAYMAQQGAEVLLFPGSVEDAEHAIRAVRATGREIPFIGGDAASGLEEHAAEFAGARYTAFFDARLARTPEARAFVAAFEQRFGHAPDQRAALAYDAAMLIGRAALDVGHDRRRVRDALAAIDSAHAVEGAAGRIAFDANQDATGKSVVVATVGGAAR